MSRFHASVSPHPMTSALGDISVVLPEVADADLVRRARDGDRWAEGLIYRRHAPMVARLAAHVLRHRQDVMDVVHDVFLGALCDLDDLRDPAALRGWLRQRTIHRLFRMLRARRAMAWVGLDDEPDLPLEALTSPSASPEVRAEIAVLSRRLDRLPLRQRMAWVLHRVEGETLGEVASACGVSLATAKRDIAAAAAAMTSHEES